MAGFGARRFAMPEVRELPAWELALALFAAATGVVGGLWLTGAFFAWVARTTCAVPEGVAFWVGVIYAMIAFSNTIPDATAAKSA